MATLAFTITVGNNAGASLRALARAIEQAAMVLPDVNSSGASVVCTLDNAPATGLASVAITGPYASGTILAG